MALLSRFQSRLFEKDSGKEGNDAGDADDAAAADDDDDDRNW